MTPYQPKLDKSVKVWQIRTIEKATASLDTTGQQSRWLVNTHGDIMSRIYEGMVSIIKNTKGEIALKRDDKGDWSNENAEALKVKMLELADTMKADVHKWSYFVIDGGIDAVLMADRYGNPRLTILPKQEKGASKSKIEKLA